MTQPYDRHRVPTADVIQRQKTPLSDIWRRWFGEIVNEIKRLADEKVGLPWKVEEGTSDLYPDGVDAGVGTLDNPAAHFAVGTQEALGIEGVVVDRNDSLGGGIALVGYRKSDPVADPTPNAPVEIAGVSTLISNGTMYIETGQEITEDRHLIAGPSIVHNSKNYFPVLIGPAVIYSTVPERAEDDRNINVADTNVVIVSLTTAIDYDTPSATSFRYGVRLNERSGRETEFVIQIFRDDVLAVTNRIKLNSAEQYVVDTIQPTIPAPAPITIRMEVTGETTHQQCLPFVEGAIDVSFLEVRQG